MGAEMLPELGSDDVETGNPRKSVVGNVGDGPLSPSAVGGKGKKNSGRLNVPLATEEEAVENGRVSEETAVTFTNGSDDGHVSEETAREGETVPEADASEAEATDSVAEVEANPIENDLEEVRDEAVTEVSKGSPEIPIGNADAEADSGWTVAGGTSVSGWTSVDGPVGIPNGNSGWEVAGSGVLGSGPEPEGRGLEQAPRRQHFFYMVRVPRSLDTKGRNELIVAQQRLKEKTDERDLINAAMHLKKTSCNEVRDRWKAARQHEGECLHVFRAKQQEMLPLKASLKRLNTMARERGRDLPMSEGDLDDQIAYLEYRIQHESMPLREEKQLLRDIKQLGASREQVRANAAFYAEVSESLGQREGIEEQLKPLNEKYKELESELHAAGSNRLTIEKELRQVENALRDLQEQLAVANRSRQEAYEAVHSLNHREYARNDDFFNNKREIQTAKQIAQRNDKKAVEVFCNAQVEQMLALWNSNAEFRANYVKNNERSTLRRLETLDGRSLGPDEEPPLLSSYTDGAPSALDSQAKTASADDAPQAGSAGRADVQVKGGKSKAVGGKDSKMLTSNVITEPTLSREKQVEETAAEPSVSVTVGSSDSVEKDTTQFESEKEAAETKEKRRAEEMVKAKEAEERKRRMAERSQSKALARAQKEAERREKEKEKKARKKAAAAVSTETSSPLDTTPPSESSEDVQEVEAPLREEKKVNNNPRRSGASSSPKARAKVGAAKAARGNTARTKLAAVAEKSTQHNLFGLPRQIWLVISIAVVLIAVLALIFLRKKFAQPSGAYNEGTQWRQIPDVSPSHSYSH